MTSLPAKTNSSMSLPAPVDPALARTITALSNRLEKGPTGGYSISDQRTPTERDRVDLQGRLAALKASLIPCAPALAAQTIGQLLMGYHARASSQDEAKAQLAVFTGAVNDLPLWAIQAGCGALIRRNVAWPPTAGQVRGACSEACQATRDEIGQIERILDADVYHEPTTDERAKVKDGFEKLLADLKLRAPLDPLRPKDYRPPTRQEAEQWLEREKLNPHCPEPSDLLRAQLGLSVEKIGDAA